MRVKAPDNDSDEIFCYYTGKDRYINAEFDSGSEYVWVKLFETYAVKGAFTLRFKYKEPGIIFDKIIMTSAKDFVPTWPSDFPKDSGEDIYPLPPITPKDGHPRLFATKERL